MPKIKYTVTNGTEENITLESLQIEVSDGVKDYLDIDAEKRYHWKAKKQKQQSFYMNAAPDRSLEKVTLSRTHKSLAYIEKSFDDDLSESEFRMFLLFEGMSPIVKEAVELYFIYNCAKTEIAQELGKSESAVRQNIENGARIIKDNFNKYKQYFNNVLKDYYLETVAISVAKDNGTALKQVYHIIKKKRTLAVKSKVSCGGDFVAKFYPRLNKRVILFSKTSEIEELIQNIDKLNTDYSIVICASRNEFVAKLKEKYPLITTFNKTDNGESLAVFVTETFKDLEQAESDKLIKKYR